MTWLPAWPWSSGPPNARIRYPGWPLLGCVDPRPRFLKDGHLLVFPIQKCGYFVKVKEVEGLRGDVACYVAQAILLIDTEIGEIDHLWMETRVLRWRIRNTIGPDCRSLASPVSAALHGYSRISPGWRPILRGHFPKGVQSIVVWTDTLFPSISAHCLCELLALPAVSLEV